MRSIKSRQRCTADVEIGQRSTTLCLLVNIAREIGRVGEKLLWDPVAERFTGQQAALAPAPQGLRIAGVGLNVT
jgi:hypothetical protein